MDLYCSDCVVHGSAAFHFAGFLDKPMKKVQRIFLFSFNIEEIDGEID